MTKDVLIDRVGETLRRRFPQRRVLVAVVQTDEPVAARRYHATMRVLGKGDRVYASADAYAPVPGQARILAETLGVPTAEVSGE
jgi:hypothetical protein